MNITYRQMFAANCTISGIMGFTFSFVGIPWYYVMILSVSISIFTYMAWAGIFHKEEKMPEKPPYNPKGKAFHKGLYKNDLLLYYGHWYSGGATLGTSLYDTEYQENVRGTDLKCEWWLVEARLERMPFIPTELAALAVHQ